MGMEQESTPVELDDILNELGQFGKFQAINYLLLCVIIFFSAIFSMAYVFSAGEVRHRCRIRECEMEEATYHPVPPWIENATALEMYNNERAPQRCFRYRPTDNSSHAENGSCPATLFYQNSSIRCHEWAFDAEERTIVSEWNIVCTDAWRMTLVGTINNVGQAVGLLFSGIISDKTGRKTAVVFITFLASAVGLGRSFTTDYISFMVLEFLEPALGSGMYTVTFVLCMELVGAKKRVMGNMLVCVSFSLGQATLGAVSWWLKDWRLILQVLYGPPILLVVYYWLIPESVRWLMTQGRTDRARGILLKAAKTNGVVLPSKLLDDFLAKQVEPGTTVRQSTSRMTDVIAVAESPSNESQVVPSAENKKGAVMQIMRSNILLLRLLACSFCWMANTFVYYGLSLYSVSIGGNKYLNFILSSFIELPASGATYYFSIRLGRRITQSASLILSGLCCTTFLFIPTDLEWLRTVSYMAGKFAVTISFTVLYIYTTELFPTQLRQSLLGICSMFGRVGSAIAPQTPLLAIYMESLPVILFGAVSFISGLVALIFPETHNCKLPDTVLEAERISKKTNS